jgi:hypothetical protein
MIITDDVINIDAILIKKYGGLPGIREEGLLASAAFRLF